MAVIVGRIMIDSTMEAGNTPGPLRSVEKNGTQLILSWSQLQAGRTIGITTNNPHKPYTTLGIAASNSIRFFNRSSILSGNLLHEGDVCRFEIFSNRKTVSARYPSLKKMAAARPNSVPSIKAKTDV